MKTTSSFNYILFHILAWAAFILYEVSIVLILNPTQTQWWEYAGYYLLNIFLFYFNAHLLFYYVFKKRNKWGLIILLIPLELAVFVILKYQLEVFYDFFRIIPILSSFDKKFILGGIWRGVYFLGLSIAYWFVLSYADRTVRINHLKIKQAEAEKKEALLEKELIRSQNAYLRAQINPHLLFNTLSFVYNAVYQIDKSVSESILLLSDLMHYSLSQNEINGKIKLSDEIAYIKKYIALNQIRFRKPLQLKAEFGGKFELHHFPPLLLLTFVENMFKHGVLNDPSHPASLSIYCTDSSLALYLHNKKRFNSMETGFGIGVQNFETRLRTFYSDDSYSIDIHNDEKVYQLYFRIYLV